VKYVAVGAVSLSVNSSPVLRDQKGSDDILPEKENQNKKKYRSEQSICVSVINVVSFCFCKELVASVRFVGFG
jgi:hypothetical protein